VYSFPLLLSLVDGQIWHLTTVNNKQGWAAIALHKECSKQDDYISVRNMAPLGHFLWFWWLCDNIINGTNEFVKWIFLGPKDDVKYPSKAKHEEMLNLLSSAQNSSMVWPTPSHWSNRWTQDEPMHRHWCNGKCLWWPSEENQEAPVKPTVKKQVLVHYSSCYYSKSMSSVDGR